MPAATTIDFAKELNSDQLSAITHGDGPQLVLAGAGSGKTRVLTTRIACSTSFPCRLSSALSTATP